MRFLAILLLSFGAMAADPVAITTKGYYELWVKGGVKVSQHTSEREAVEYSDGTIAPVMRDGGMIQ